MGRYSSKRKLKNRRRKAKDIAASAWDYGDVATKVKMVLFKNNFEFTFRFSQSSASFYVLASRGKRLMTFRFSDHPPASETGYDLSFSPASVLNGTFEKRVGQIGKKLTPNEPAG